MNKLFKETIEGIIILAYKSNNFNESKTARALNCSRGTVRKYLRQSGRKIKSTVLLKGVG